jgi:hypothetical protein
MGEYLSTGRATVYDARLYLPNGEFIPNDRSNRGLKYAIDTWIAENTTPAPDTRPPLLGPLAKPAEPIAPQREAPPQQALSFEAIRSEVHMAEITDITDTEAQEDLIKDEDQDLSQGLFDIYEVLATEKRRRGDAYPARPKDAPASVPASANAASAPANTARPVPQYRYQSNAEDQHQENPKRLKST